MLPRFVGIYRTYALEIIGSGISEVTGAFIELKSKTFLAILR
jgi:hypothetical protein